MEGWVRQEEELRSDVLKMILYELNTAISPKANRIKALKAVFDECNHSDPSKHDQELDLHADKILFQKLALTFSIEKYSEEVGMILGLLELVYRASRSRVALSYNEIGDSILPVLIEIIRENVVALSIGGDANHPDDVSIADSDTVTAVRGSEESSIGEASKVGDLRKSTLTDDTSTSCTNSINSDGMHTTSRQKSVRFSIKDDHETEMKEKPNESDPLAIKKVLKILRYYSRVLPAMVPMAHQPGLLDALIYQLNTNLMKKKSNDAREALRRNLQRMTDEHDILDTATAVTSSDTRSVTSSTSRSSAKSIPLATQLLEKDGRLDQDSLVRVDIIATIVNLACAEENKNKLLYHPGLLETVISVAKDDPTKEAREHAAIAIMNLALAEPAKQFLVNRHDVLEAIIKLLEDEFSFTRRYASATIFALSCHVNNTKPLVEFSNYHLIATLCKLLECDKDDEVRVNSAKTIFQLTRNDEPHIVEDMVSNSDLLLCLAQTVISDYSADVRAYSARALEWMAADIYSSSPCHNRLLIALAKASAWTKTTCIAEALKTQSTLAVNRKAMVENDAVLDALAMLAALDGINDTETQECALMAIENLTMEESTRGTMAGHQGVMTVLARATFKRNGVEEYDNDPSSTKIALKNLASHITFDD